MQYRLRGLQSPQRTVRRLLHTSRLYAVLSHVGEAVIRLTDRGELFESVCRIAVEHGNFRLAWVGLVEEETGSIRPTAVAGPAAAYLDAVSVSANDEPLGRGPSGTAIREGHPVINNDLYASPAMAPWQAEVRRHRLRASAAFPLRVHGKPIGTLNLYADRPGFFDAHEIALLERVAGSLAFALEKLLDDEQRHRDEQARRLDIERQEALLRLGDMRDASEREIVDYALEEAVRLTRSTIGYLHFITSDQVTLELFTWSRGVREACYAEENTHYPIAAAGVWVDCLRQRRPVYHNDYQRLPERRGYPEGHIHIERHLSVPLIDGDLVVAIAGVGNKVEAYDENDARQLLLFMSGMWTQLQRKRAEATLEAERAQLEAKVAERTRELKQERDRTRAILESLGEAVMVFDTANTLEYMNPAASTLTGISPESPDDLGSWWSAGRLEADDAVAQMRAAVRAGRPWQGEAIFSRSDGMAYDAAVTVTPLFDPDQPDQPVGYVSVHRDITAMKVAERMKDQFVSNVSHELRSPTSLITMLAGNLEMLYQRLDDARRLEVIGAIRKHARDLSDLIGDVLEISRIDGGRIATERRPLNLTPLVYEEVRHLTPIAQRKSLRVDVDVPDTLPVIGQAGQLQQVLRNLLTNAIKYTPDGGAISWTGRIVWGGGEPGYHERAWPGLGRLPPGAWAAVMVTDSGIGIGPTDLPHIFERFYRARTQGEIPGTGLGLSIAAELVKRHGGHLEVSSALGKGSSFAVYLPLAEEAP